MKNNIVLISILLLAVGCENNYNYDNSETVDASQFGKNIILKHQANDIELYCMPLTLVMSGDSLLFMNSIGGEYAITKIDLLKNNQTTEYIEFGGGPNDMTACKQIQIKKDTIFAFDRGASKVMKYSVQQLSEDPVVECLSSVKIKDITFENILVTPNHLITQSYHYPDCRFVLFNSEGSFMGEKGALPYYGKELSGYEKNETYLCRTVNYKDSILFLAYYNTDLIEKYDINGNLLKRVHGPGQFFPEVKEVKMGDRLKVTQVIGKSRLAFESPSVVDDELWVLYSGELFDPRKPNSFLRTTILVYDHALTPLRRYELDIGICTFCVDTQNRLIYASTVEPENRIIKFPY